MIREEKKDAKGQTYTVLIPENEKDLSEIEDLDKEGEIDARESFGDDPEVWGFPVDAADQV